MALASDDPERKMPPDVGVFSLGSRVYQLFWYNSGKMAALGEY
jgi:hypothetical protein